MRMRGQSPFWCGLVAIGLMAGLLAGCSRDPNVRKQKYLESGQRYFDKGQYKEAAIQFQNAIQVDSRFADAHYKLAETAMKMQQWPSAFEELRRTVELQPENYAAHLDMAKLLLAARQAKDAKDQLDLVLKAQPNNPDAYLALSTYNSLNNDTAGALASLQKALQLDPNRSESYLYLAALQMHGEQWDAAEASFKKATELDPKSTNALLSLAKFYEIRGRYPDAEPVFQRAIQSAPTDPEPRAAMAQLYMAENKLSDAENFLKQAKKDFPNTSAGYRLLGDFYYANNQLDKAVEEYASLSKDHPRDQVVKKNYVQLLILKNQFDPARKLNDEVLKATPDDLDSQISKGAIELRSGKPGDAVNILQAVLKNDPQNGYAHYQLGLAFDLLGNTQRAEQEWRDAARLRPDLAEAHRVLAGSAIRRGDASVLAQEADQIIALQPGAPDGYLFRAIAEIDRKKYALADDFIRRSLEKDPRNTTAYVQRGNLRVAQGQMAEAQKSYQQALDIDANSTDALGGVLNTWLKQNQPEKALAVATEQSAKNPNNTGFHIMVGQLLLTQKNDPVGAQREFQKAVDLDRNNTEAMVKLGMVQNQQGASDKALQTYMEGAKNQPRQIVFPLLAGGVYQDRHDWDKAKQMYQRALEIQPENPIASNNLAYVMLQQGGNVDVALAMAQTARRQLPDNPNSADTLGWAYYQKGVYTSAISLCKEAVDKDKENLTYNYHLGMAYAKSGQKALAKQQLDHVGKIKPNSDEANDLRRLLTEAKS